MKPKRNNMENPKRFLMSGVRLFLRQPELSGMTIENSYGAISMRREPTPRTAVHAVGFAIGNDEEYDDDDYDE